MYQERSAEVNREEGQNCTVETGCGWEGILGESLLDGGESISVHVNWFLSSTLPGRSLRGQSCLPDL